MTFRTRILLASLIVAIAPLVVFALGARREVQQRLTQQYQERVDATSKIIREDVARHAATIDARLRALAQRIESSAPQRAALLQLGDRAPLLDYALGVMPTTGLDYLLLLDTAGTVLSSGHFRNEYDRSMAALPQLLAADGPVLVATRRAQGSFRALVRTHKFSIGERQFVLAGGIEVDSAFMNRLARNEAVTVSLDDTDDNRSPQPNSLHEQIVFPFIDDAAGTTTLGNARWTIAHSLADLEAVRRGMDAWLLAVALAAIILAIIIARIIAERVNRPLEELAAQSTRVHLDRLDVGFAMQRQDEIGSLSRLLDSMVQRLRRSANELRAAERRATVGDMARQVNHDIRNGLLPIRNVITHLTEVARAEPGELRNVFVEREGTLQGGISYLESLATNYARLSPRTERRVCDVNAVIRAVLRDAAMPERTRVQLNLSDAAPRVLADPVALRRIIENLTINAMESLENGAGSVTVKTDAGARDGERRINISIADSGSGIEAAALDRIFDDFYSTKERGSGLGLSIVRRLVADMGGRIRVASEPHRGTTFVIELPEAP
jgi:signal transduction histidine kinase